jgi:hypothetical protein
MKLRRLFGFLLVIAAAIGFLFSAIGLIAIWRYRPAVTQSVTDNLALFDQVLKTTQDGLTIVGQVVQTTASDVNSLLTTIQTMAKAIHDTNPMFDSLTNLTSKDFPSAVSATQSSLALAQNSALVIYKVLTALTSIPFLPVTAYKPDSPLHTTLSQISASLNSLTPLLATITNSLTDGKTNLGIIEGKLNNISDATKGISSSLANLQTAIDQYQTVTTRLKVQVETAQRVAPAWIMAIAWILSFFIGWLLVAQWALCAQGFDMLRSRREVERHFYSFRSGPSGRWVYLRTGKRLAAKHF